MKTETEFATDEAYWKFHDPLTDWFCFVHWLENKRSWFTDQLHSYITEGAD